MHGIVQTLFGHNIVWCQNWFILHGTFAQCAFGVSLFTFLRSSCLFMVFFCCIDFFTQFVYIVCLLLLRFLDDALVMTPIRREHMSMEQEGKEPYGPACRDYFWIICRLVDNLEDNESNDLVDLDHLARQLACGIVSRKLYEKRHGDSTPDDTLVGALQLLGVVMKQVNIAILIAMILT